MDYRLLMRNRDIAKFSFKVCFIVYDPKYSPQLVKLDDVYETLKYLTLTDEYDIPNLGLVLIRFDKRFIIEILI